MASHAWLWPVAFIAANAAAADPCGPNPRLQYPVEAVLASEALNLAVIQFTFQDEPDYEYILSTTPDPKRETAFMSSLRVATIDAIRDDPYLRRDVKLLGLLQHTMQYRGGIITLLTSQQAAMIPEFRRLLTVHGATEHLRIIDDSIALFGNPNVSPRTRYQMAFGSDDVRDPALRDQLYAASDQWLALTSPYALSVQLINTDPEIAAIYEDLRRSADDVQRQNYMIGEIWSCFDQEWWTPDEADAVFDMTTPQAQIAVLDLMMAEIYNGSADQLFFNSSGTLVPQMEAVLRDNGLPDHADLLVTGMGYFGTHYPRDTDARRDIMLAFPEGDERLYALTWLFDDGQAYDVVQKIAVDAGLWPVN